MRFGGRQHLNICFTYLFSVFMFGSVSESDAGEDFRGLSSNAKRSVLLCFFLGVCMFASVVVICLKALADNWIDSSLFNSILVIVFLVVAFVVILVSQYYFYRKKRWDYFVGISKSITESN
jgi:undecaprenyl pyrophosphate phosphatase UppP